MRLRTPFALSLSKGCPCALRIGAKKEQGFDELSPDGILETFGAR